MLWIPVFGSASKTGILQVGREDRGKWNLGSRSHLWLSEHYIFPCHYFGIELPGSHMLSSSWINDKTQIQIVRLNTGRQWITVKDRVCVCVRESTMTLQVFGFFRKRGIVGGSIQKHKQYLHSDHLQLWLEKKRGLCRGNGLSSNISHIDLSYKHAFMYAYTDQQMTYAAPWSSIGFNSYKVSRKNRPPASVVSIVHCKLQKYITWYGYTTHT